MSHVLRGGVLRMAKTSGPLRFTWSWPEVDVSGLDPTMVIVSRDSDGRWYVTFAADTPTPEPLPAAGRAVGVDLGIRHFAVTSSGQKIANPRRLERKARSARNDFLHRASTHLVRGNDTIVIEDLNVSGMVRNRRLARVISDCGWREFRRQLEYKCQRYGRRLIVIDRWYPSSKTCSTCGHLLTTLTLGTRHWTCPSCGTWHDRDVNAAKNILAAGQAVTACEADVSHPGSPGCNRQ